MTPLLPQYGIGIEYSDGSLTIVAMKKLWGRYQLVGKLVLPNVSTIPPAECKRRYAEFLQDNGLKAPWTVVSLPRRSMVYREIVLPYQVKEELHAVISFQVDSFHPYADREIVWDCCLLSTLDGFPAPQHRGTMDSESRAAVAVSVGLKEAIDELAGWYAGIGIPVSQFVASPLLLIARGLMPVGSGARTATIVITKNEDEIEVCGVGLDGGDSIRSAVVGIQANWSEDQRLASIVAAVENVCSNILAKNGSIAHVLLGEVGFNKGQLQEALGNALPIECQYVDLEDAVLATSAARLGVAKEGSRGLNLMPVDRRQYLQTVSMMPTYVLCATILLLCLGLVLAGTTQDWRYHKLLKGQIAELLPRIEEVERERDQNGQAYEKILYLGGIRQSAREPVEILEEITDLLPSEAWLNHVQMEGSTMTLSGSARSASGVLQALANSGRIESPQFLSAISRGNDGVESFRIGARLRVSIK